jgi:hypothetical protein
MNKENKETLSNQDEDSKLCLNCGFPNRLTDTYCMYCKTSLVEDGGFFAWIRQTYYILKWRWQLKQKRNDIEKSNRITLLKASGYFLLGAFLSGVGVYVFSQAVSTHSFSRGLIAVLFLCYGIFTLKTLFSQK